MSALTLKLQALADLFGRYRRVFGLAWRHRAELDSPRRAPHELEFLPSALALQDTPVSPAPRVAMALIVALVVGTLAWSWWGRLDLVATAQGRIVLADGSKLVQPLDTSVVQAIHVHEGEAVHAGQLLVELDASLAQADQQRLSTDLADARSQVARAQALLAALAAPPPAQGAASATASVPPPSLGALPDVPATEQARARQLLQGQYDEYQAKAVRIAADLTRREAELRSVQAQIRKLESTLPITSERAADYKALVEKNFASRHGYLDREQQLLEQQGDLALLRSRLREAEATLAETRGQREQLLAETRRAQLDALRDGRQKIAALTQELRKADTRGRQLQLLAPVDGVVQQLAVHTVGGVVTPAQTLMIVVPRDHALEAEVTLDNRDVGFVHAGQGARVKVETFPYTRYGTIGAEVRSVSRDAVTDDKRGLIYAARVTLQQSHLQVDGQDVPLSPGMAVTVEVKTGTRRVIDYFLRPLMELGDESLKER
jgi:hemolysin D